ncbi:MAG TPA: ABC transporter ATP-binding protein [Gemmatimonadales bacterium]|nr:ABC transporter ATP-binding protein [Gemmatimonadales bacterium]
MTAARQPAALQVQGLAAPFGNRRGLTEITLDVAPGERVAIVGGSGAGKTTLLRAIAGLGPTTAGRVLIAGRDVSAEAAERRDAVYLHQTPLLFPHLSAGENVAFPLRIRGVPPADVARRVHEALDAVKLGDLANRSPRTLSGGQRHRVALARAVVARPSVLLLDEPLSALDPALREEIRDSLLVLQRAYEPAVVLVTHELHEVGSVADRIGVLLDGRLAQVAPPAILFARPASLAVARFLGIPNLLPGAVRGGSFESPLGRLPLDTPAPNGPAVAVLGADGIAIAESGVRGCVVAIQHGPRVITAIVQVGPQRFEVRLNGETAPPVGSEVAIAVPQGHSATVVSSSEHPD